MPRILEHAISGFGCGLYTPFNLRAGIKHWVENISGRYYDVESLIQKVIAHDADYTAYLTALSGHFVLGQYAFSNGYWKEYLGLLVVSNIYTYFHDRGLEEEKLFLEKIYSSLDE